MKEQIVLSPYRVYWVEFRAIKGIVTKRDEKILRKFAINSLWRSAKCIYEHFGSKDAALDYLRTKDFSKLSKNYEVRVFTDKQFSMGKYDMDKKRHIIPFTSKQEKEMFVI